jgi:hypothetical protein
MIDRIRRAASCQYDEYRCRYLYKAADALATSIYAPVAGQEDAGSKAYRRARAFARMARALAPGTVARSAARVVSARQMPFPMTSIELLGFGSGSTVFLVRDASDRLSVLKIFRKSLGRNSSELRRQLEYRRSAYATVARWYRGLNIVPASHFLLLHGPILSLAAVGCLQPLIPSARIDLLHGMTDRKLTDLVSADAYLLRTVQSFIRRTIRTARMERASIDLVGKDNVVLVRDEASHRLVILDQGIYRFDVKASRDPDALARLHDQLQVLEQLGQRIQGVAPRCPPARRTGTAPTIPAVT